MKLFFSILAALSISQSVHAIDQTFADLQLRIVVPDSWTLTDDHFESLTPPQSEQNFNSRRKIHFEKILHPLPSIKDTIEAEIDRIDARSPRSSNARANFLGISEVSTTSGIQGYKADFGDSRDGAIEHSIVKFYFRHQDGSIFKVCAHVYGDGELSQRYEDLILNGLSYINAEEPNKALQPTPIRFAPGVAPPATGS